MSLTIRVSKELRQALVALAEEQERTVSSTAERVLSAALLKKGTK